MSSEKPLKRKPNWGSKKCLIIPSYQQIDVMEALFTAWYVSSERQKHCGRSFEIVVFTYIPENTERNYNWITHQVMTRLKDRESRMFFMCGGYLHECRSTDDLKCILNRQWRD